MEANRIRGGKTIPSKVEKDSRPKGEKENPGRKEERAWQKKRKAVRGELLKGAEKDGCPEERKPLPVSRGKLGRRKKNSPRGKGRGERGQLAPGGAYNLSVRGLAYGGKEEPAGGVHLKIKNLET